MNIKILAFIVIFLNSCASQDSESKIQKSISQLDSAAHNVDLTKDIIREHSINKLQNAVHLFHEKDGIWTGYFGVRTGSHGDIKNCILYLKWISIENIPTSVVIKSKQNNFTDFNILLNKEQIDDLESQLKHGVTQELELKCDSSLIYKKASAIDKQLAIQLKSHEDNLGEEFSVDDLDLK